MTPVEVTTGEGPEREYLEIATVSAMFTAADAEEKKREKPEMASATPGPCGREGTRRYDWLSKLPVPPPKRL